MRTLEVDHARLTRWCDGFAERHGGPLLVRRVEGALELSAGDGVVARLFAPFPLSADVLTVPDLAAWAARRRRCAVVLVRRGGYGCALLDGTLVVASKVGTRYVQSRTAAGGWSQQRFARRREGQARELVAAVADVAAGLLLPVDAEWLVTGGDRPLLDAVLAQAQLAPLQRLVRGPHLQVPDPRADVVRALPNRLRSVRITLP